MRNASVKWFDPPAYALWRDAGLLGFLPDGTENRSFRSRNTQRDLAFANALYRTGLRVQELGSVLLGLEWPVEFEPSRRYHTLWLAEECAKRGHARDYWAAACVVRDTFAYLHGERALAVAKAQQHGRYEVLRGKRIVLQSPDRTLELRDDTGAVSKVPLDALTPSERRRLFVIRNGGLEPAQLWLNSNGLPRSFASWNRTFARANQRIQDLGLDLSPMSPHRLRHSFALRWFIVGRLLWQQRAAHLTEDETLDLREEMGSHWNLVQTMLGHSHPHTTMNIYLEPFRSLDIQLLMEHVADESVSDLLAALLRSHPRVQSLPSDGAA